MESVAATGRAAGGRDGLPARRLLLDAASALAVIGVIILAASVVLAPGDESASPEASASALASAAASATPLSSSAASPAGTGEPAAPTAAPTVAPPSGGYAVGSACADVPDCWFYVVRGGDTIATIGSGLGVTRTGILALNAGTTAQTSLTPGSTVRVPTPSN